VAIRRVVGCRPRGFVSQAFETGPLEPSRPSALHRQRADRPRGRRPPRRPRLPVDLATKIPLEEINCRARPPALGSWGLGRAGGVGVWPVRLCPARAARASAPPLANTAGLGWRRGPGCVGGVGAGLWRAALASLDLGANLGRPAAACGRFLGRRSSLADKSAPNLCLPASTSIGSLSLGDLRTLIMLSDRSASRPIWPKNEGPTGRSRKPARSRPSCSCNLRLVGLRRARSDPGRHFASCAPPALSWPALPCPSRSDKEPRDGRF